MRKKILQPRSVSNKAFFYFHYKYRLEVDIDQFLTTRFLFSLQIPA